MEVAIFKPFVLTMKVASHVSVDLVTSEMDLLAEVKNVTIFTARQHSISYDRLRLSVRRSVCLEFCRHQQGRPGMTLNVRFTDCTKEL